MHLISIYCIFIFLTLSFSVLSDNRKRFIKWKSTHQQNIFENNPFSESQESPDRLYHNRLKRKIDFKSAAEEKIIKSKGRSFGNEYPGAPAQYPYNSYPQSNYYQQQQSSPYQQQAYQYSQSGYPQPAQPSYQAPSYPPQAPSTYQAPYQPPPAPSYNYGSYPQEPAQPAYPAQASYPQPAYAPSPGQSYQPPPPPAPSPYPLALPPPTVPQTTPPPYLIPTVPPSAALPSIPSPPTIPAIPTPPLILNIPTPSVPLIPTTKPSPGSYKPSFLNSKSSKKYPEYPPPPKTYLNFSSCDADGNAPSVLGDIFATAAIAVEAAKSNTPPEAIKFGCPLPSTKQETSDQPFAPVPDNFNVVEYFQKLNSNAASLNKNPSFGKTSASKDPFEIAMQAASAVSGAAPNPLPALSNPKDDEFDFNKIMASVPGPTPPPKFKY